MDVIAWVLIGLAAVVLLWFMLMMDVVSTLVLVLLAAILGFLLVFFGFVDISATEKQLDVNIRQFAPTGTTAATSTSDAAAPSPILSGPEVFYVADNKFTYRDAPYVCKAYNAELASYIQVEQAYNAGAEWCGYGWSAGGIALFPTQQASWEARMADPDFEKREVCGRPGVNGGYFDPKMKFGVNCYGIKPKQPATPRVSGDNDRLLGMFKDQVNKLVVDPFKKDTWSKYNIVDTQTPTNGAASVPSSTQSAKTSTQSVAPLVESVAEGIRSIVSSVGSILSSL